MDERSEVHAHAISLSIPCGSEYMSVVRLALAAICRLTPMSDDEATAVRVALEEAAAGWTGAWRPSGAQGDGVPLGFRFVLEEPRLVLEVACSEPKARTSGGHEIVRAIIEASVDESQIEPGSARLVKYLNASA